MLASSVRGRLTSPCGQAKVNRRLHLARTWAAERFCVQNFLRITASGLHHEPVATTLIYIGADLLGKRLSSYIESGHPGRGGPVPEERGTGCWKVCRTPRKRLERTPIRHPPQRPPTASWRRQPGAKRGRRS